MDQAATILAFSADEFGVTLPALLAKNRHKPVALARQVAMFLTRELTALSLPQIGRRFGGRDHTTVLHGVVSVTKRAATDADLAARMDRIRLRLGRETA